MATKRKGSSFRTMQSERTLESIFLFVTGRCNAKCAMCFYAGDMDDKLGELTFDEIKKISETAGNINKLWISGGEPTLREDLPEIIEMFYRNNHIKDINWPTNGLQADRVVEWVKRIRKSCPECNVSISVSMDGFTETHDKQRGVPGNFYKALDQIKKINDNFGDDGYVLQTLATVMTKYNVDQISDLMYWIYGRFNSSNHIIEAARGETREEGVKVLTEQSLRAIQDEVAPMYSLYAKRMAKGVSPLRRPLTRFVYQGFLRTMFNIRADNLEGPKPWGMDCTAGETTLVIDYDGRFRACELRPELGNVKDYGCDVQAIMNGEAMKKEIEAIGHGHKANCWCTHGCWISASLAYNPKAMKKKLWEGYRETRRLNRPVKITEEGLQALEAKYNVDRSKLAAIGVI
ncbi:MAG: radical SAM protein [Alistipes sp.]|nr:radical SAM protein [Alistipes sp.]